jgi:hypothetical protein
MSLNTVRKDYKPSADIIDSIIIGAIPEKFYGRIMGRFDPGALRSRYKAP